MTLEAQQLLDASLAGEAAATAIKPGEIFLGAMPAARAAGYVDDTPQFRMFLNGYLDALHVLFPRGVACDADGRVVAID